MLTAIDAAPDLPSGLLPIGPVPDETDPPTDATALAAAGPEPGSQNAAALLTARWVGGSGNWSDTSHWDIGVVPNNTADSVYQVVIDVAGAPTITLAQNVVVSTLSNAEELRVSASLSAGATANSGSIVLTSSTASLSLSGAIAVAGAIDAGAGRLQLVNAMVSVTGSGAIVRADAQVQIGTTSLVANGGGVISLLGATGYADGVRSNFDITASGSGSRIDLSNLATMAGSDATFGARLAISASNGGRIDLAGAIGGYVVLTLADANSTLNVAKVTSLGDSAVVANNGGTLNFSALSQLSRVNLSAGAGAQLLFPVITSYADGVRSNYDITASGSGSLIDLSHLNTLNGSDATFGARLSISASNGGRIDLAGAIGGYVVLTLADANSTLNVAKVTSLGDSAVVANNGGTLTFSTLTQLTRVNLSANGGAQLLFPVITSYADGVRSNYDITASGSGSLIDLSHLNTLNGSDATFGARLSISASNGGRIDLAGAIGGYVVLTLADANSTLNVAKVTSLGDSAVVANNGGTLSFSTLTQLTRVNLSANGGAQLLFPVITSYADGVRSNYDITASGSGSRIDLSNLATMGGSDATFGARLAITASNGGRIDLAGAIGGYVVLTLADANSTLNVAKVASLGDSAVVANNGGTLTFSTLTQLTRVNLSANGGAQLLFPVITSYADGVRSNYDITASGSGSRIDLSNLATMGGSDATFGARLAITASNGGRIDLAGAIGGYVVLTLADANSTLNVAKVASLGDSAVVANNGGTLGFSTLTQLTRVNLSANGGAQLLFPVITSYADGVRSNYDITASGSGSRIDLSNLATMGGSDATFGARLSISASNGGRIDLAGAIGGYVVLTLADANSTLNVAKVASLGDSAVVANNGGTLNFSALTQLSRVNLSAGAGAQLLFPVITSYADGVRSNYDITASGTGSRIDLSNLATMGGSDATFGARLSISASNGGRIDLAGAIGGYVVLTLADANSTLNVAKVASLGDSAVVANNGGTLNFSALTQLSRVNLSAGAGAQLLFPVITSYADGVRSNYDITASGTGSRIDLSNLATMAGSDSTFGARLSISASNGGRIDLAGAIGGYVVLTLADANSTLNVAKVTSLGDSAVVANNGGTLNFSALTQLSRVNLSANGGAQLLFPVITSYADGVRSNYDITASGTGSRIDLSNLATMAGSDATFGARLAITASNGGRVALGGSIGGTTHITQAGIGSVIDVAAVTALSGVTLTADNSSWTLPYPWRPTLGSAVTFVASGAAGFINHGILLPTTSALTINSASFVNHGVLAAQGAGAIDLNGPLRIDGIGVLGGAAPGTISISGDLLGSTNNAARFAPAATIRFDGNGTAGNPQRLEAMSWDLGSGSAGFDDNFAYGTLALAATSFVRLVDLSDNVPGSRPEAVYANTLIVPAGTTLDLNGVKLYARSAQVAGAVLGGPVVVVPDGGALESNLVTPGRVAVTGEADAWTFFGRQGQSLTLVVDPGSAAVPVPRLGRVSLELFDAAGRLVAAGNNSSANQLLSVPVASLPVDGLYRVVVKAPAALPASTGQYLLTLSDAVLPAVGASGARDPAQLWVASSGGDATGLSLRFNTALDVTWIDAMDIRLTTTGGGAVAGTLSVDADGRGLRFAPDAPLASGSYTLTLHSAYDGVRSLSAGLLDGDLDGAPGGDFVQGLRIAGGRVVPQALMAGDDAAWSALLRRFATPINPR